MDIREKIKHANEQAVGRVVDADPVWIDALPACECVEGLEDHMILHSGPPIEFKNMCFLHRRGMVSGALFEGWAKNENEAVEMLNAGEIKIDSALNHNTDGAGTGIITKSTGMFVVEDKKTGARAAMFPAEGQYQGGLCGWGLYSPEIADNLRYMSNKLLPVLSDVLKKRGGLPLKPILTESLQLGDENHTRQVAADYIFVKQILPDLIRMDIPKDVEIEVTDFLTKTPRFFHALGQCASRVALLSAENIPYSTMVTLMGGNGIEYGIKVSGLAGRWFTAPAQMMEGLFTSSRYTKEDQLPWLGDSCVVECAGMGGLAAATSPIVCNLRGVKLKDAIAITREMDEICISKNHNYAIPNLDFDFLPVGIDIRKVLKTGISPSIHGGMFSRDGGLIGAGGSRVPMPCFEKAMKAFAEAYRE